jgi:hypothetical protein
MSSKDDPFLPANPEQQQPAVPKATPKAKAKAKAKARANSPPQQQEEEQDAEMPAVNEEDEIINANSRLEGAISGLDNNYSELNLTHALDRIEDENLNKEGTQNNIFGVYNKMIDQVLQQLQLISHELAAQFAIFSKELEKELQVSLNQNFRSRSDKGEYFENASKALHRIRAKIIQFIKGQQRSLAKRRKKGAGRAKTKPKN